MIDQIYFERIQSSDIEAKIDFIRLHQKRQAAANQPNRRKAYFMRRFTDKPQPKETTQ